MAKAITVQGVRKYADEGGQLRLEEGEYGRSPANGQWYARPPDQRVGCLAEHKITEHEDGTISVKPSILVRTWDGDEEIVWHGYLKRGVWREV